MPTPSFQSPPTRNPYGLSDIGDNSTPVFADLDKDGDLDALVGARDGTIKYFKNNGTVTSPSFSQVTGLSNPFNGVDIGEQSTPSLVDIDKDGDLDAFIGEKDGIFNYYKNTGTATNPVFTLTSGSSNPLNGVNAGNNSSPTFADIDGDGDFDLFSGRSNGDLLFFKNDGTATNPIFLPVVTNPFGLSKVGSSSIPTLVDIDLDGDLDLFVGEQNGTVTYFQNTGTTTSPSFSSPSILPFGLTDIGNATAPTFADLDGDSLLDAIYGDSNGSLYVFKNTTPIAPVTKNDTATTNEDTSVVINILSNDTDVNNNISPSTVVIVTAPTKGSYSINATTGAITYTPNANSNGTDSFTYSVSDTTGNVSNTATVNLTILPVNDPPVANNDSATTNEDTAVTINVLANDTDVENDPRNLSSFTQGANGTVTRNNNGTPSNLADDKLVYTPNANFNGTDSFTYRISDGNGGTSTATVNLTIFPVNDAPVATNESATTNEDTAVTINILANDTDVDGEPINLASFTQGTNGTVTRNNNGTPSNLADDKLVYTPNANFNGTDSFTYTISDGNSGTNTATVNLTILPVNDVPVANNESVTTNEDTAVTINVLANDIDVDGDPLNLISFTQGANGTVTRNDNGTPSNLTDDTFTYTPNANFNERDSFTYTISDGNGGASTATVNITVNSINDPPVATNDTASVTEGESSIISVFSNDSDPDIGDILTINSFTNPSHGTLTANGDGTFTYTANLDYCGPDNFTYTVKDSQNALSNLATVNLTVNPYNHDDNDQGNILPLTGTACPNILNGNGGDDTIQGKGGNDTLNGGNGANDRIFGGDGDDQITDPDGINAAHGGAGNDIIDVTFSASWNGTMSRSDGKITGGYGDDIITVTMNKSNFFINMKGDEPISNTPQDGNDTVTLLGNYAYSVVDLGGGDDTFTGGVGNDAISGGDGNDLILGMAGNDALAGQNGNDTLQGGLGIDNLIGGAGSDLFVLTPDENRDTITDFSIAEGDKIGLADGLQFSDLTFLGSNILFGSQTLAILNNVSTSTLSANDFVTL